MVTEPNSLSLELADISDLYNSQGFKLENSKSEVSKFSHQLNTTQWSQNWIMVEEKVYLLKLSLKDAD